MIGSIQKSLPKKGRAQLLVAPPPLTNQCRSPINIAYPNPARAFVHDLCYCIFSIYILNVDMELVVATDVSKHASMNRADGAMRLSLSCQKVMLCSEKIEFDHTRHTYTKHVEDRDVLENRFRCTKRSVQLEPRIIHESGSAKRCIRTALGALNPHELM